MLIPLCHSSTRHKLVDFFVRVGRRRCSCTCRAQLEELGAYVLHDLRVLIGEVALCRKDVRPSTTSIQPHFNLAPVIPAMGDDLVTNLPTLFNPRTCVRRGLCPVTTLRKQDNPVESHSLYFGRYGARCPRCRPSGY